MFSSSASQVVSATQAEAIDFDGTNDYLSRASDLTGNADGKTFTFSAWVWPNDASNSRIYQCADGLGTSIGFEVSWTSGTLNIYAKTSANTFAVSASISNQVIKDTFFHILVSCDVTNAANRSVYINDVNASVTWTTYSNLTIDFTRTYHNVCSNTNTNTFFKGRISNVYLDYTYRDLSVTANRRLFVTADLKPAAGQAALNPILYLPMSDPTQPGKNLGTGGDFTLTGTVARSGRGPNQYNAPYSDLDGTVDYLSRTTALTGIADGKQFTFACVLNTDLAAQGTMFVIGEVGTARFQVLFRYSAGLAFTILGYNASGTKILDMQGTYGHIVTNRNYSIVASIDLTNASNRHLYIDGVAYTPTYTTYTNDNIDFLTSTTRCNVGANATPASYYNGRLGALYFDTSYIDLSVQANREKFVTGTGIDAKPVDLGASGELPTGTSPLIYLPMYGNDAGKNYGTGGDFTVNSGPYTGARGPNEFWGNLANFDGTSSVLARTSALTGISDGKTFSLSFYVSPGVISGGEKWLSFSNAGSLRGVAISFSNTNLRFFAYNSSGTAILDATCGTAYGAGSTYWVQISVDLSNSANRGIYINGLLDSTTWSTYSNATISFTTGSDVRIGQDQASSFPPGKLSELYFTTDYIDFSQEANRLKFRDAFGNPVDLTPQITANSIPNPAIYMRFPPTSFGTNSGTGGDFTVNGTITDGGQL